MTALQIAGLCLGVAILSAIAGLFVGAMCSAARCADCQREMMAALMAAQDVAREALQAQK